jgi:non-ribosomal peptide synthetase component F
MSPAEARRTVGAAPVARPDLSGVTLDALLHSNLDARGGAPLLRLAEGEPFSYAALDARVDALAGLLRSVEPVPGSQAVIAAPLAPEAIVAVMAAWRAGMSPHAIPASVTAAQAEAVLTATEAPVAIGVSDLAELRPLLSLRAAAARSYHLRLLAGFGASVPDGVAPIDLLPTGEAPPVVSGRGPLYFTLPGADGGATPCTEAEIMALALDIAHELRPSPASRLVTTMSGIDAATLASSIGVGLIAGIEVTTLGLFNLARLWGGLTSSLAVHLVAPAAIKTALDQAGITRHKSLASLILIHEAGLAPPASALLTQTEPPAIIDVWRGAGGVYAAERRKAGR